MVVSRKKDAQITNPERVVSWAGNKTIPLIQGTDYFAYGPGNGPGCSLLRFWLLCVEVDKILLPSIRIKTLGNAS